MSNTTLTRAQIAEIVGNDTRKIRAFENLQKSVQTLTEGNDLNVGATTQLQDATVITLSPNDAFNNERVLSVGSGLALSDSGPGGFLTISLLYSLIINGGYSATFNTVSDTNLDLPPTGKLIESQLGGAIYASDAAAATGGVAVGEIYKKTGGTVAWRVS